MAKKQKQEKVAIKRPTLGEHIEIVDAGIVQENKITETLEKNYMPYAMSVIISRALPEIDGFKPSHRKLLYTMYEMGLLKGTRTKSANIVGTTMRLNPHGDGAIYETMVRLSKGNEALLTPYVDSKGNFGKFYSRDMAYAASRYTEAKLTEIASLLFADIDKDTVDFIPNYDNKRTEPTLLPVSFPSILTNCTLGIAVGMASSICSFNLIEICKTTIELLNDSNHPIETTLIAPDFIGGGKLLYNEKELKSIYETGRGAIKVRSKYAIDEKLNNIEITEIPYTTTIEAIMDKIAEQVRAGKIREISDMRDETDLNGLKLTLDLKRGVDAEKLMSKLFATTPLEDGFFCNFNIILAGMPKTLGVKELLIEWIAFRLECVKRRTHFEIAGKQKRLHLLKGLKAILLDIDKAIKIVRETTAEPEVVPNLMIGFGIDEVQAEYVAEIKLRQLNKDYILKRTSEIENLINDIDALKKLLESKEKLKDVIKNELLEVIAKYGIPRKSEVVYNAVEYTAEDIRAEVADYPVTVFYTQHHYVKKITPLSLRNSAEHKLKEGDVIISSTETKNDAEMLFFTTKQVVYKCYCDTFDDTKVSQIGEFAPVRLGFEEGELPLYLAIVEQYTGFMIFVFEDGKVAKISISSYETKQNRKKLLNAFSDKSGVFKMFYCKEECDFSLVSTTGRCLVFNTAQINIKTTKNSAGVQVFTLKKGNRLKEASPLEQELSQKMHRYRVRSLPSSGAVLKEEVQQLEIL